MLRRPLPRTHGSRFPRSTSRNARFPSSRSATIRFSRWFPASSSFSRSSAFIPPNGRASGDRSPRTPRGGSRLRQLHPHSKQPVGLLGLQTTGG